jgi:hypothetical protein
VDCAEWVQIHHLYAMLKLLGPYRFDLKFGLQDGKGGGFWFKEHRSTGLKARMFFERMPVSAKRQAREMMMPVIVEKGEPAHDPRDIRSYIKELGADPRETEQLLKEAPVGSRIMWSNGYFQSGEGQPPLGQQSTFTFENTVKLGDDNFGAHGFAFRKEFTRHELERKLADNGKPDGMSTDQAVETYIFIEQIEFYETVAEEPWQKVAR